MQIEAKNQVGGNMVKHSIAPIVMTEVENDELIGRRIVKLGMEFTVVSKCLCGHPRCQYYEVEDRNGATSPLQPTAKEIRDAIKKGETW